jgi:uncharacterized OsmC-like protein
MTTNYQDIIKITRETLQDTCDIYEAAIHLHYQIHGDLPHDMVKRWIKIEKLLTEL